MNNSEIIAKCYLKTDGDEGNVCLLTDESLFIRYKSHETVFFNHWITETTFKHKKFVIPIVFGGISASLSAIALLNYYFNPWIILSILFASIMTIYYGINGGKALTITTPIKEYDFFINEISENLKAFVAYASTTIQGKEIIFFFQISKEDFVNLKKTGFIQFGSSGQLLKTSPPKPKEDKATLSFGSKNLPFEVKYINDSNGHLRPYLFDKVAFSLLNIEHHPD